MIFKKKNDIYTKSGVQRHVPVFKRRCAWLNVDVIYINGLDKNVKVIFPITVKNKS